MKIFSIQYVGVLLILFAGFSACDEVVIEPFEEVESAYSIYGAMELDSTLNYVRIKDTQSPLLADLDELRDFTVTFENLTAGTSRQISDTVIYYNNNPTLNFVIDEVLTPRTAYKLTVEGDEGDVSTTMATTPGVSTISLTPEVTETCLDDILIEFDNVADDEFIRFELGVQYDGSFYFGEVKSVHQLQKVEGTNKLAVVLTIRNMLVDVFPPVAEATVNVPPRFWNPTVNCSQLDNGLMRIRYTHFGPEWEVIRQNTLALDVLESGDVENGLGFFGAKNTKQILFNTNGVPNNN